jgi:hypothetical protein
MGCDVVVVATAAGVGMRVVGIICGGVSSGSGALFVILVLVCARGCSEEVGVPCGVLEGSVLGRQADKSATIPTRNAIENLADTDSRLIILLLLLPEIGATVQSKPRQTLDRLNPCERVQMQIGY